MREPNYGIRVLRMCQLTSLAAAAAVLSLSIAACTDRPDTPLETTVQITFRGDVELHPGLLNSAPDCVTRVLVTRVHASWRRYEAVAMIAVPPGTWQITFGDVPIDEAVRIRVNDKNWCDRTATGAVLAEVTANGVPLVQNTTTPGSTGGEEPGFAFTVDASGRVEQ
jgi:hypothetical protein